MSVMLALTAEVHVTEGGVHCRHRGSWLMEDWLAFTETFSLFLLHDLDWEDDEADVKLVFEDMWTRLRQGVLYFLRFEEGQHTSDRILEAQNCFLEYGKIAERVCAPPIRTLQRHHVLQSGAFNPCITPFCACRCLGVLLCAPTSCTWPLAISLIRSACVGPHFSAWSTGLSAWCSY